MMSSLKNLVLFLQFQCLFQPTVFTADWDSHSGAPHLAGFNSSQCVPHNDQLNLLCSIYDETATGYTMWTGSDSIFNCPNVNTAWDRKILLSHRLFSNNQTISATCTENIQGRIILLNGMSFISLLSINITYSMNGGEISCQSYFDSGTRTSTNLRVGVVPSPPRVLAAEFRGFGFNIKSFRVGWQNDTIIGGLSKYIVEVHGEGCGECSHTGEVLSNEVECFGWQPVGQVCNVSVAAVTSDCGFMSIAAKRYIHLKNPAAPRMNKVIPTYSQDNSLKSVEISMENNGEFDENGLRIDYKVKMVTVQNSITKYCRKDVISYANEQEHYNVIINIRNDCHDFKNSAISFHSDSELTLFSTASTSIGESVLKHERSIRFFNNFSRTTIEDGIGYNLVITKFPGSYELISFNISYGPVCDKLDDSKYIFGINESVLCHLLQDTPYLNEEMYCMIATIAAYSKNTPITYKYQMEFKGFGSIQQDSFIGLTITGSSTTLLFFLTFILCIVILYRNKQYRYKTTSVVFTNAAANSSHSSPQQEPYYEEIENDPRTRRNAAYENNDPRTRRNAAYESPPQYRVNNCHRSTVE